MNAELERLIREAEHSEALDDGREALARWREAVAIERTNFLLARLGRRCTLEGLFEEAERVLNEAKAIAPDDPEPRYFLGFLHQETNRLEEAAEQLSQALAIQEWVPAMVVLGEVYRRLNVPVKGRAALERAVELEPENSEAWYGLALTYRSEDRAKASELFRRAILTDPAHGAAYRELGQIQWACGEASDAEVTLRTALAIDANDPWAHVYLGHVLLTLGRLQDAETAFRQAITLSPDVPLFHCNLGDVFMRLNRMRDAEAAYKHALALDTSNVIANRRMGQFYREVGRYERARKYLTRAVQLDPSDQQAREALATLGGTPD